MNIFKNTLSNLFGDIYVPKDAMGNYIKILHISDTPSSIYRSITRLVKKVNPDVLIHTGDIADDVKLEMVPKLIESYKARANRFLSDLSPFVRDKIIIVPGNHDDIDALDRRINVDVVQEGQTVNLYGVKIGLAHKSENLPSGCSLYMFGHKKTDIKDNRYINGIDNISIINIDNLSVIKLYYPYGTDNHRMRQRKIGF